MEDPETLTREKHTSTSASSQKEQKFLFDHHNFDDGFEKEQEEEIPPPPTFNEEELAAAKKEAFTAGKNEGLAEAAASRDKYVADLLKTATNQFQTLLTAEDHRARLYEKEAVTLAHTLFEKLFPHLNEKHGLGELEVIILKVLETQKSQENILIEVHPDYTKSIEKHIESSLSLLSTQAKCTVQGNDTIGPADCHMSWKNGGALRNTEELVAKIGKELEDLLADRAILRDNEIDTKDSSNSDNPIDPSPDMEIKDE